ncbi:hypothetical protein JCM10207_007651 [Rhodosporidiobolus poonsookiae]
MDDPVVTRHSSPSSSSEVADPTPPLPLASSSTHPRGDSAETVDMAEDISGTPTAADRPPQPQTRQNALTFIGSSSPSRTFSRLWDRLSPPSVSSPFSLPHPPSFPSPGALFGRSSAPPHPPTSAPLAGFEEPFRRRGASTSGAVTPAEERELASQLTFSLRRSTGRRIPSRDEGREGRSPWPRSAGFSTITSSSERESFRLLPDVRMPAMPWKGKGREADAGAEDDELVDDEACFVDGWEGKVDFLVSLPSELAIAILLHLDFRSILACSAVSQYWRTLALDPLLWRELFHQNPRWHLRPEAYQAAAAAAAAAQLSAATTPMATSPHPGASSGSYFDIRPPNGLSSPMPTLKRAASSFGRAGAKRVLAGADRVSSSSAALGRKISEIAGDIGNMHLLPGQNPGSAGGSSSRGTSRAPSEADEHLSPASTLVNDHPSSARPSPSRRSVSNVAAVSASLISLSTASAGLPSTSTLQTNAFASPPSANGTLARTGSSTALSSLSSLPSVARRPSTRTAPPTPAASLPVSPTHPTAFTPFPAPASSRPSADFAPSEAESSAAALYLDWPRLFRDKWLLERNWTLGQPSWSWFEGHEDSVYCVQFDKNKVVSGSRDKTIRIWDLASGSVTRTLTGHVGSVLCLQYDDRILVSGSSDARILVWDMTSGEYELKMTLVGHAMGVLDLCFDDQWIVSCSKDTTTRVWHRSTGELYRTLQGHRGPVNAVQLHGDHVLSASGDALLKLWDLHTGQALRTFTGHSRGLACVHWAPSGRFFVSGSNDKTIRLWDAHSGECLQTFTGHGDLVRSLCYDEKSARVVSASYDRTTRVWDAETGEMLKRFKSHASLVFDVQFDASRIVSCSHDQRILLMDFAAGLDVDKFA